jgi:hypothetical protein
MSLIHNLNIPDSSGIYKYHPLGTVRVLDPIENDWVFIDETIERLEHGMIIVVPNPPEPTDTSGTYLQIYTRYQELHSKPILLSDGSILTRNNFPKINFMMLIFDGSMDAWHIMYNTCPHHIGYVYNTAMAGYSGDIELLMSDTNVYDGARVTMYLDQEYYVAGDMELASITIYNDESLTPVTSYSVQDISGKSIHMGDLIASEYDMILYGNTFIMLNLHTVGKAKCDDEGHIIHSTYETKSDASSKLSAAQNKSTDYCTDLQL